MKSGLKAPKAGHSRSASRGTQWYIESYPDGKRARSYYPSRDARDAELRKMREAGDTIRAKGIAGASQEDVVIAKTIRDALQGRNLMEMLGLWKRHISQKSCSVKKAAEDYLRTKADAIEKGNNHTQIAIDAFRKWFKGDERLVNEITRKDIQAYFDHFRESKNAETGGKYAVATVINRHKVIRAWLNWCRKRDLLSDMPVHDIDLPKRKEKKIGILSVSEVYRVFYYNHEKDPEICLLLALGAFAGLRTESILQLEKAEIHPGSGIDLPAEKFKTETAHFATGLPDNLWPWIMNKHISVLGIAKRRFEDRRKDAATRAGIILPHNWARHSFATYYSALHGDVGKAATVLGHRSASMTWSHYKGRASEFAAKVYFGIRPDRMFDPGIFDTLFKCLEKAVNQMKLNGLVAPAMLVAYDMTKGADDSWMRERQAAEQALLEHVDPELEKAYLAANYGPGRPDDDRTKRDHILGKLLKPKKSAR